jgi:hypothetical protein
MSSCSSANSACRQTAILIRIHPPLLAACLLRLHDLGRDPPPIVTIYHSWPYLQIFRFSPALDQQPAPGLLRSAACRLNSELLQQRHLQSIWPYFERCSRIWSVNRPVTIVVVVERDFEIRSRELDGWDGGQEFQ